MILADSSIWIEHFRSRDGIFSSLLEREEVAIHPFVVGEMALGTLRDRAATLKALTKLPQVLVAREAEVMTLIESSSLFGLGIGYVDAHLLTSARLTDGVKLWTKDKRLHAAAARLNLAAAVLN